MYVLCVFDSSMGFSKSNLMFELIGTHYEELSLCKYIGDVKIVKYGYDNVSIEPNHAYDISHIFFESVINNDYIL